MKQKASLIAITIIMLSAGNKTWSQRVNNQKTNIKMETSTTQKNKAIVRSIFEQAINKNKPELLRDLIDDEYTGPRGGKGYESFLLPIKPLLAAFPDIQWKIEAIIGEGDAVIMHWKWQGTHTAPFTKHAATGKQVINEGMGVFELKHGKVISTSVLTDRLGFWQQIGVLPLDI